MKKNQVIKNNVTGETLTMLVSDEENGGACQLYEVRLPPHRPSPPLHYHVHFMETFTVKQGKLDIYVDREQRHLVHDAPVIFTIETKPAGGVVKAFQLAYGIANDGGAALDGLPKNSIARLAFVKTAQGYLPGIPLALQRIAFRCAALMARVAGLEKKWQVYFT